MTEEERITVTIDGRTIDVEPTLSIIEAAARCDALTANVGCMGQGVCGACRCLVRHDGEREVRTRLACETRVEPGMQVSFIDYFTPERPHRYDIGQFSDSWSAHRELMQVFPQAAACRHCGGCDRACPKGIEVQRGVALAVAGDLPGAAAVFDPCVMCNLCTLACPEHIWPNHLGLAARRVHTALSLRPVDLIARLAGIDSPDGSPSKEQGR
ncbi:2Fe-2S iron-sulfur cluster-binding protein [Ralstonia pseudosolanacearum]|nr:2Fe-2S iron-sulfur cluster-binding protein [Ralstonia pseudosolanacearum]MDO3521327.1 2Fe-2S iron-sulfur cluster-binding protein [Ralstonia pseudosolanacearum]MDO3546938.1 2Fe-2S iron-sulfur cluster-binding protein [Ralstonia pseudosolanacearum]MDO3550545.1 2Fe-2S iron-sulfur cluster-binding protein [Ralstonia pseudosolanacearum]MDO3566480.1 2Fe-2S iron-sulfur cluster-binding protein [Ralstonia pseudosolanacearum]MDO3580800.1 2Fe-2S iron-sulfur cluster-binding protein [Ralstonia pseudosolan